MVKQGQIIRINLNPTKGHEQGNCRPAVVVSNDFFNNKTNLAIVCPITNTNNGFPLHVPLDNRTSTTGVVLCEHLRTLDVNARSYDFVESIPSDILINIINICFSQIEKK